MNGIFRENRSTLRHLLLWTSLAITYILLLNYGDTSPRLSYVIGAIMTLLTASVVYLVHYRLIPRYLQVNKAWRFALHLFSALLFTSTILLTVLLSIVGLLPGITYMDLPNPVLGAPFLVIFMCLISLSYSMLLVWRTQHSQQLAHVQNLRQLAEKDQALKKAELAQLQSQLNPHFLFNTLNTLYGAALKKADHTAEMILELSALLDYSLYQTDKEMVLLEQEVEYMERYIGLEKKRLREGLNVNFVKEGLDKTISLPPLLFLPFLENAFKHGHLKDGLLTVELSLKVSDKSLDFVISNSARSDKSMKNGIGLENIKKRLAALYPDQHDLIIQRKESIFEVRLRLRSLKPNR